MSHRRQFWQVVATPRRGRIELELLDPEGRIVHDGDSVPISRRRDGWTLAVARQYAAGDRRLCREILDRIDDARIGEIARRP